MLPLKPFGLIIDGDNQDRSQKMFRWGSMTGKVDLFKCGALERVHVCALWGGCCRGFPSRRWGLGGLPQEVCFSIFLFIMYNPDMDTCTVN